MGELFLKELSSSKILWFSVGQKTQLLNKQSSERQSGIACQRPRSNWLSVLRRTWDCISLLTTRLWHPIRLRALGGWWPCPSHSRLYVLYAWHIASSQETFIDSINERMNRRQGLSKSNLVLRIRLAQFCGVEPHVISDPEFHTEECSCLGMLGERRTVTLWETETFLSSILMAKSGLLFHRHTRQVSHFWQAIRGTSDDSSDSPYWWVKRQTLNCLGLCNRIALIGCVEEVGYLRTLHKTRHESLK